MLGPDYRRIAQEFGWADRWMSHQIRSLVHSQAALSVSGFIQHAVAVALDDVAGWVQFSPTPRADRRGVV